MRVGRSTKALLRTLNAKHQVIVIQHRNIDDMAAQSIIAAKVKAVINAEQSISGEYPVSGALTILQADIPIYEVPADTFTQFRDGAWLELRQEEAGVQIELDHRMCLFDVRKLTVERVVQLQRSAEQGVGQLLDRFIDNTLHFAHKEKRFVIDSLTIPSLRTHIHGKHVLIVVRGNGYKQDLQAIHDYIRDYQPVLIGVDGGADALIEAGYRPHLIVGDMDSVSDHALRSGAEIVVHAYVDGRAPGMHRVQELGLKAERMCAPGTSEDIAMLMAYEHGAELIVTLGTHTHMLDFLQKGRKGMGSTLLVRLKIGNKLMDAKGVSKLYPRRVKIHNVLLIPASAFFSLLMVAFVQPGFWRMLDTIWLYIKLSI